MRNDLLCPTKVKGKKKRKDIARRVNSIAVDIRQEGNVELTIKSSQGTWRGDETREEEIHLNEKTYWYKMGDSRQHAQKIQG